MVVDPKTPAALVGDGVDPGGPTTYRRRIELLFVKVMHLSISANGIVYLLTTLVIANTTVLSVLAGVWNLDCLVATLSSIIASRLSRRVA